MIVEPVTATRTAYMWPSVTGRRLSIQMPTMPAIKALWRSPSASILSRNVPAYRHNAGHIVCRITPSETAGVIAAVTLCATHSPSCDASKRAGLCHPAWAKGAVSPEFLCRVGRPAVQFGEDVHV
jgi:hypothetical protein